MNILSISVLAVVTVIICVMLKPKNAEISVMLGISSQKNSAITPKNIMYESVRDIAIAGFEAISFLNIFA